MLREEAEREAERRNHEDPDSARFEFYAFDESAGMAADAWDVAARLRQGPSAHRPATAAAAARHAPATASEETVAYEVPGAYEEPAPAYAPEPVVEYDPYGVEATYAEAPPAPEEYVGEEYGPEEYVPEEPAAADAFEDDDRPGLFVRLVGGVVVAVGVLWIALVVALAVFLNPEDAVSYAVHVAGAGLGLLAIALGVAIRRS